MNNSKKTLAAGAGAGVLALALLGGGTFAAWSDYATVDNNAVGAGQLTLSVGHNGAIERLQPGNLAPGQNKFQDMYIASNDGDSVPNGKLYVTLENLNDVEDGCTNTNGELADDADCTWNTVGDFSKQATVQVVSYQPTASGACAGTGADLKKTTPYAAGVLGSWVNQKLAVDELAPGEGICVRVEIGLPTTATNAVQGDRATFDARFDLEQVIA